MSDAAWIAAIGVIASLLVAALGGIFNLLGKIGKRFTDISERAETRAMEITNRLTAIVDRHEEKDQERHTENVQRLARLEALMNGGPRRHVR